jgi:hypothetical protein
MFNDRAAIKLLKEILNYGSLTAIYSNIHVAGNCGNQAFPEMPGQLRKIAEISF